MTEGVSEENLALLEREGWSTGNLSPEMQAEFNRLLDAARAEGPAPPADATTYCEPEVEDDDGVVTVRAFSTDKLRVVSFAVHPDHVLKVTTPGIAEWFTRPAPPGGGGLSPKQAWQDLLDKDDRTSPAEYPEMALITFEELADYMAAALTQPETPDHG